MSEFTMEGWVYPLMWVDREKVFLARITTLNLDSMEVIKFRLGQVEDIIFTWNFNNATFPFSEWHHVALVKTTTNIKMFIDGVERATRNNSNALASSSFKFNVGGAVWDAVVIM